MRNRISLLTTVTLVILLTISTTLSVYYYFGVRTWHKEATELRADNVTLGQQNDRLRADNVTLGIQNNRLETELSRANAATTSLKADNTQLRQGIAQLQTALKQNPNRSNSFLDFIASVAPLLLPLL